MRSALRQSCPFWGWCAAWLAMGSLVIAVVGRPLTAAPGDPPAWKTFEDAIAPAYKDKKHANAKTS